MASMAVCHSLATLSSTKPLLSQKKTASIANLKSHERVLQSSLLGTRILIRKTTVPFSGRVGTTSTSEVTCSASSSTLPSALLFDCDGVLVDTEKDGHRISFNDTFKEVNFLSIAFLCLVLFCHPNFTTWFSCFWGCCEFLLGELVSSEISKENGTFNLCFL